MSRLLRAAAAGLVGTSWMTAAQELAASGEDDDGEPSWNDAPAPAQVARKSLRAVGVDPPPAWIPTLTHAMHWGYGTAWGALYSLARGSSSRGSLGEGLGLGLLVWAASYAQLVPFGIYDPPWSYDAKTLARDVGYHLAFGVGAVTAARALRRPQ